MSRNRLVLRSILHTHIQAQADSACIADVHIHIHRPFPEPSMLHQSVPLSCLPLAGRISGKGPESPALPPNALMYFELLCDRDQRAKQRLIEGLPQPGGRSKIGAMAAKKLIGLLTAEDPMTAMDSFAV